MLRTGFEKVPISDKVSLTYLQYEEANNHVIDTRKNTDGAFSTPQGFTNLNITLLNLKVIRSVMTLNR